MEIGLSKNNVIQKDDSFNSDTFSEHVLILDITSKDIKLGAFNGSNNALVAAGTFDVLDNQIKPVLHRQIIQEDYASVVAVLHSGKSFLSSEDVLNKNKNPLLIEPINVLGGNIHFEKSTFEEEVKKEIPSASIRYFMVDFIKAALEKNRYQKGEKIYVHLANNHLYFVHLIDNSLRLYSSEVINEESDVTYFLSKLIELSGFNQLESKLFLSGDFEETNEIYAYLKDRIKMIYLNSGFNYQKSALSLSGVKKHQYFSTITAFQCV